MTARWGLRLRFRLTPRSGRGRKFFRKGVPMRVVKLSVSLDPEVAAMVERRAKSEGFESVSAYVQAALVMDAVLAGDAVAIRKLGAGLLGLIQKRLTRHGAQLGLPAAP